MTVHELAMALRGAYLALHRRTDAALAGSGVTADQFVVLVALCEGAAMTQRELAARTSTDSNTLRAMLVLLEKQRLVTRRPHPTDGRARSVAITKKGKAAAQQLWRKSRFVRQELADTLKPREIALLVAHLGRIADVLVHGRAVALGIDAE
jgi:MarR family transcriptional regulator, lower aerobic nicotinate degradation pathway regulator